MTDSGTSGAIEPLPSLSGRVLDGRYRIDALVGAGGMGVVYAGWHIKLEKRVAIKILDPRFADRPDAVKRFLREARSASKISHRNVVEVMDFGQSDDLVYFVMEFLEGADLSAVIRCSAPLPWPRAKQVLVQIVRALKAAHAQGIVHRDIKPANCFVVKTPDDEPDVVKVLDFGIAKVVDPGTHTDGLTSTSQVIGTALYMAPEQAMGKPIDARTDVYALGTMAFEMVSGRKPFVGATGFEVLMKRVNEPPPSVRDYVPSLDAGVEAMIQCAMARNPDERFQSMRAFEEALVELPGEAASGDAHMPLLTEADLVGATGGGAAGVQTADGVVRGAASGTSTRTVNRVADATPAGLGMPLSGPVGITEVGPPLGVAPAQRASKPGSNPSEISTISAPVSEEVAQVFEARVANLDDAQHPEPASGKPWWALAAVVVLGLAGVGLWMSRVGDGTPAEGPSDTPVATRAVEGQAERGAATGGASLEAEESAANPAEVIASADGSAALPEDDTADAAGDPVVRLDQGVAPDPELLPPQEPATPRPTVRKKKKKKGGRKPKPPATRAAALSALGSKAKKRCDAEPGTKVVLDVFVSAAGTFSTPRDRGSTAGADAVSCVIGIVKATSIPSGASELRRVKVTF